jgi:hypothetical protein
MQNQYDEFMAAVGEQMKRANEKTDVVAFLVPVIKFYNERKAVGEFEKSSIREVKRDFAELLNGKLDNQRMYIDAAELISSGDPVVFISKESFIEDAKRMAKAGIEKEIDMISYEMGGQNPSREQVEAPVFGTELEDEVKKLFSQKI